MPVYCLMLFLFASSTAFSDDNLSREDGIDISVGADVHELEAEPLEAESVIAQPLQAEPDETSGKTNLETDIAVTENNSKDPGQYDILIVTGASSSFTGASQQSGKYKVSSPVEDR